MMALLQSRRLGGCAKGLSRGANGTQSLQLTEESSEADSSGRGMPARHESPAGRGAPACCCCCCCCWWRALGPGDARSGTKCTASGLLPALHEQM